VEVFQAKPGLSSQKVRRARHRLGGAEQPRGRERQWAHHVLWLVLEG
jgi:hypothetical protein